MSTHGEGGWGQIRGGDNLRKEACRIFWGKNNIERTDRFKRL